MTTINAAAVYAKHAQLARVTPKHIPLDTTPEPADQVTVMLGGVPWLIGVEGEEGRIWPSSVYLNGAWLDIGCTFSAEVAAGFMDALYEAHQIEVAA
jgi:hypothetical protein